MAIIQRKQPTSALVGAPRTAPTEEPEMLSRLARPAMRPPSITPTTPQQTSLGMPPKPMIGVTAPQPGVAPVAKPNIAPVRPMIQPPMQPGDDQGYVTDFGPGNDLRSSQINPLASDRLTGTQGMVDTLRSRVGQGPSLSDAAGREFDLLGQRSAEQRQLGIRNIGQASARLGRLGSGMVTTDLGNLEDVLRTREEQARSGLSADVARGEASDRRANLGAIQGLEGQLFGQEAGQRGELRTERGYQTDTARDALDRRVQQRLLEESLLNSGFNRELAGAELGLRGSELYSNDAEASGGLTQDLLTELGRAAAAKRGSATTKRGPVDKSVYETGY